MSTPPPEITCRAPWGNRRCPASSSGGGALDGAHAGFGLIDGLRGVGTPAVARAPALFRLTGCPVDREPLAPLGGRLSARARGCASLPVAWSRFAAGTSMTAAVSGTEVPSIARDRGTPCREPHRCAAPAGRPGQLPCVFTGARGTGQVSLRHALAGESRPRTLLRLLQVDVSTSTTTDRPNISTCGDPRPGRLRRVRPEVAFRSRQPPELLQGQGPSNRCSAPPVAMARDRGFAPTPIAPGTSCRRTPPLTGLERLGERRLCRRRTHHEVSPSKGELSAGHPRRYPASIRPRCLLSPAFASERARTGSRSSRPWSRRLFHHVEAARGTPTCALDGSTDRPERVANHRLSKRRSAPE
jgi:hypothetical protein